MCRMHPAGVPRLHSLDALRAAMMLLGLVLHSAVSYITTPLGVSWPYKDPNTSIVLDLLVFVIHLCRMPTFFVVAGFFAALLYHRDGAVGFVRNRARRVLMPLAIFWGVMIPLCGYGFVFAAQQVGGLLPWEYMTDQPMWRQPVLGHLWFLYYLLWFYLTAIGVVWMARRAPASVRDAVDRAFRRTMTSWWGPLAAGIVTALTFIPMTTPGLDTDAALVPAVRVVAAYGIFFLFGWLLCRQPDLLESFAGNYVSVLVAGAAMALAYAGIVLEPARFDSIRAWHLTGISFAGLATWLLIFGMLGLFVRHLSTWRPAVRYLSDASYWMYLTHLAPAIWLPGLFAHLALPAVAKFLLVFALTTVVTVVSYHYLVRPTAIGELLNGRRYPRVTPLAAPRRPTLSTE